MCAKHLCIRWAVDLKNFKPSLKQLTLACSSIQPEEKTRLMKFHFIDDFLSSLVGRLLIRKFVSETTTIPYNEIKFARDDRGKPYLKNSNPDSPQISFNVSHQGNIVVLAGVLMQQQPLVVDFGIGIDVMKIEYTGGKTLSEFFRIMTRHFSDSEWRYINSKSTEHSRLKAFIRHWCLKESYVKNIGVGITVDLQNISFNIQSDDLETDKVVTSTTLCVNDVPATMWNFQEHILCSDYCVAVAFKNCTPDDKGVFKFISFDELLLGSKDTSVVAADLEEYCRNVLQKKRRQMRL